MLFVKNRCNKLEQKGGGDDTESLFHKGNHKIPLYGITAHSFGITDVVKAVFRSRNKPGILCEEQPMRVQYNAVFLINLKHVPMKDLVADGNGTFTNRGQPTHTIEICSDEDESENEDEKMSYPQVKVLARAKRPLKCKSQFLLQ